MKKIVFGLLICMVMIFAAGCSGDDPAADQKDGDGIGTNYNFTAAELAQHIYENVTFRDFMEPVDEAVLYEVYDVDGAHISDACSYFSTGATAEEITVMTGSENGLAENLAEINEAYNERIEDQIESFENYVPEELEKLGNALRMDIGNTVVLVVCDDKEQAEKVILEYIQ